MESVSTPSVLHRLTEKGKPRRKKRHFEEGIVMSIKCGGEGRKKRTEHYSLDLPTRRSLVIFIEGA